MPNLITKFTSVHPLSNFLVALFYAYIYDYVYKNYIATVWEYTAFRQYHAMNNEDIIVYLIMAAVPFVFYKGLKYLASAFSIFVYIFVYIPFLNALFVYNFPSNIKFSYSVSLLIIVVIYFLTDWIALYKNWAARPRKKLPFSVIPITTIFLFVLLIILNRSQLHFVNFVDDPKAMYEYRENAQIKLVYVLCWLRAVFLPLLILYYLQKQDYIRYGICFLGFVLLFMLDQQKLTIVFPFAITVIFFSAKFYSSDFKTKFHLFLMGIFIIIPLILISNSENLISAVLSLIIVVRIQCIAGKQFEKYMDFFVMQDHPFTYYTHINIINVITGLYPYKEPIGMAINVDGSNSNATFFLMDGVAAAGLVGCIIIGVIFLIVKSFLNSLSFLYSVPLLTALFLFPLQSLMNVSLFTSLLSHGAILLYFILLFVDIKEFSEMKLSVRKA